MTGTSASPTDTDITHCQGYETICIPDHPIIYIRATSDRMSYLPSRDFYFKIHQLSSLQAVLEVTSNIFQTKSVFIQSEQAETRVTKLNSVDMFLSCFHKLGFNGPLSLPVQMSTTQIHDVFIEKL